MNSTLAALSFLLFGHTAQPAPQADDTKRPRLIVLVVVDQMIPEQFERLAPHLDGGFARFREGQLWLRAAHDHAASETAPGHASIATGVHPARHGIVGNRWSTPAGAPVYCVGDGTSKKLGPQGPIEGTLAASPANLLVPAIGDHLKAAVPGARVVGVAGKDRAAVLSTGKTADLALWWDRSEGGFTTSSWYGEALPAWVDDWNDGWRMRSSGYVWDETLPDDVAATGTGADDRAGEPPGQRTFPHVAPEQPEAGAVEAGAGGPSLVRWVFSSPLIDLFAVELAAQLVERYELGDDDATDLLFVGLTGCDTVGHAYGPYSREVTDLLLRADASLGKLFDALDERLGPDGWCAALSSDHGVLALPEMLAQDGLPARRADPASIQRAQTDLRSLLTETFGADLLMGFFGSGVRLSAPRMQEADIDPDEARELVAEYLAAEVPWIQRTFTPRELRTATDPLAALTARSYHPERSADVTFAVTPWTLVQGYGTSHGSPWLYDRQVPLAFWGAGSPRETRYDACRTVDLLPTLFARAGLPVPDGLDGTVLDD